MTLNFTVASKNAKEANINASSNKQTTYWLPSPNDKRLTDLTVGDTVTLGGRRCGKWGSAIVLNKTVTKAGTSLILQVL